MPAKSLTDMVALQDGWNFCPSKIFAHGIDLVPKTGKRILCHGHRQFVPTREISKVSW